VRCLRSELANSEPFYYSHAQKFLSQVLLTEHRCCGLKLQIHRLIFVVMTRNWFVGVWGRCKVFFCFTFSGKSLNKDWIRGRVKHIPHQHRQQSASGTRVRKFYCFGGNLSNTFALNVRKLFEVVSSVIQLSRYLVFIAI